VVIRDRKWPNVAAAAGRARYRGERHGDAANVSRGGHYIQRNLIEHPVGEIHDVKLGPIRRDIHSAQGDFSDRVSSRVELDGAKVSRVVGVRASGVGAEYRIEVRKQGRGRPRRSGDVNRAGAAGPEADVLLHEGRGIYRLGLRDKG